MFRMTNLSFSDHEQSWQNLNHFILIKLFQLKAFIEEEGYSEEQVYNVDECGLWWKFPPTRTIKEKSRQTAGLKLQKSRSTILLGGNASGNHKLKPFFIHTSLKPHAFRNVKDVTKLPVIWNANKKAWMKASLFEKWFIENFLPSVKAYCRRKDIPFKILLLVENCTGHQDLSHIDQFSLAVFNFQRFTQFLHFKLVFFVKFKNRSNFYGWH